MKHRIEYYDKCQEVWGVFYVECSTYGEAIALFRQAFKKERFDITEVAKVYDRDWSNY